MTPHSYHLSSLSLIALETMRLLVLIFTYKYKLKLQSPGAMSMQGIWGNSETN